MGKFKTVSIQALIALLALGLAGCQTTGEEEATGGSLKQLTLFKDGVTAAPFMFWIGSPDNWLGDTLDNKPESGGKHGNVLVEPAQIDKPNDAKKVTFKADSQVYLQSKRKVDLEAYLDSDGAMLYDVIVHKAPEGEVATRVDCGYPCIGRVETGDVFRSLPIGKKATIKIPLACFAKVGTKFIFTNTPWLINTPKPFVATFGNIRYVPGAGKDADAVKCVR